MKDKGQLLKDLLKLGVCFRTRLSENDLSVYAEMIDRNLSDRQWSYAFDYYTGNWTDPGEAPKFMPTPQELIAIGRSAPEINKGPTPDQIEFRRLYQEQMRRQEDQAKQRPMDSQGHLAKAVRSLNEVTGNGLPLSDEEWEARRRVLMAQADELFHEGESPK